jgi:hypothetical protein
VAHEPEAKAQHAAPPHSPARPAAHQPQPQGKAQHAAQPRPQPTQGPAAHASVGHAGGPPAVWQQHRAHSWQTEHRTWQQRGGYHGFRIPDERYREHFGRDHGFRIHGLPMVALGGYPRFEYDGLWFSIVDPLPEDWSDDWYDDDDVYIEYFDGGYYLDNRRHPGARVAISVYVS